MTEFGLFIELRLNKKVGVRTDIYTLLHTKQINNEDLL